MIRIKSFKWDKIGSSGMPHAVRANLLEVDCLAKTHGWTILRLHPNNYILNLERGNVKMNVYLSTFTIQTALDHPKQGKTQLNRKNLTVKERELVFKNPRFHTKKGYHNA
jgi:hypothetical protein